VKRVLVGLLVALFALGVGGAPAHAAKPPRSAATITLDPNSTGLDLQPTAADWSNRTGASVIVGSCEGGPYCVEFSLDECNGSPAGCAWAVADEAGIATCHVSIEEYGWDYWLTVFVISHEVGHCLTWIGGAGFFHVDDRPSILNSTGGRQTMQESQTKIEAADRKMIYEIFHD
jgi:hypothetical protein